MVRLLMSIVLSCLPLAAGADKAPPPVRAVPAVDLQRYVGTWYELARLPNRFQADCAGDVTAQYAPRHDGSVAVLNQCRTLDGGLKASEGRAVPTDTSQAKLKVNFLPGWLQRLPIARGDYWVVMLDADYRWAVVSEPSREHLWVLARSPLLSSQELGRIVDRLAGAGYPTADLVLTRHAEAPRASAQLAKDSP